MAITKIHPIQRSVLAAVNYITDKSKTDGELLVSSYACAVHTADLEFAQTASLGTKRGDIKAQHLIQAFAPGEVSPSLAHEIGMKLAMEVTGGKYEFVLATHVDKNHVHNHILFNRSTLLTLKSTAATFIVSAKLQKSVTGYAPFTASLLLIILKTKVLLYSSEFFKRSSPSSSLSFTGLLYHFSRLPPPLFP